MRRAARPRRRLVGGLALALLIVLAALVAGSGGAMARHRAGLGAANPATRTTAFETPTSPAATPVPAHTATPAAPPSAVPASTPLVTLPGVAELSAPQPDVLWALMNDRFLFRSLDRGSTWEQRPLPANALGMGEISFVSAGEGWLLTAGSPATQCTEQRVSLWHTADAGSTWQQLVQPESSGDPTSSTENGIAAAQCKDGLSFVDPRRGFLAAWDQNHPPVLYRTNDGGSTWTASAPLPDPPGFTTHAGGFALRAGRVREFGTTLLVPVQGAGAVGPFIFRSTDGGANWTLAAQAPLAGSSIGLLTATRWLQLGGPGQSVETSDGGAKWHAAVTEYTQAAPIAPAVVFADAAVGYATVRGGIKRTMDGGAQWTAIPSPGTSIAPG